MWVLSVTDSTLRAWWLSWKSCGELNTWQSALPKGRDPLCFILDRRAVGCWRCPMRRGDLNNRRSPLMKERKRYVMQPRNSALQMRITMKGVKGSTPQYESIFATPDIVDDLLPIKIIIPVMMEHKSMRFPTPFEVNHAKRYQRKPPNITFRLGFQSPSDNDASWSLSKEHFRFYLPAMEPS